MSDGKLANFCTCSLTGVLINAIVNECSSQIIWSCFRFLALLFSRHSDGGLKFETSHSESFFFLWEVILIEFMVDDLF